MQHPLELRQFKARIQERLQGLHVGAETCCVLVESWSEKPEPGIKPKQLNVGRQYLLGQTPVQYYFLPRTLYSPPTNTWVVSTFQLLQIVLPTRVTIPTCIDLGYTNSEAGAHTQER